MGAIRSVAKPGSVRLMVAEALPMAPAESEYAASWPGLEPPTTKRYFPFWLMASAVGVNGAVTVSFWASVPS